MRYFTGVIFCVLIIAACSTPEALTEEPVAAETEVDFPEWYHINRVSSSDSTHFHGYSMATAIDSAEAIRLGEISAITNLRYEIDKFAEEVRVKLATSQSSERHSTPQFIIRLRNSVQELQLTDSEIEREFKRRDDSVTQVYTRATLNRSEIIDRLSETLSDEGYIRAFQAE